MNELPTRKNIRLKEFDYSSAGYYFITICVKDGHEVFWADNANVGANCVRPRLSEYGNIAEKEISILSETYNTVDVVKHVVMPNHIHIILAITVDSGGRTQFAPTISRVIKQFKGSITKQIGFSLWQRSYHDHIIRNEEEFHRISQYIDENPARWEEDEYYD